MIPEESKPSEAPQPPPVHRGPARTSTDRSRLLLVVLIVLVGLLIVPYVAEKIQFALTRGDQQAKAEVARARLAGMDQSVSRFRLVAQSIEPSVVGIDAVRTVGRRRDRDDWFGGPVFEDQTQGSGVIIDSDGYVLTNFHVIDEASHVSVQLSDGRCVESVRVVGADPYTDLAVLKIDAGKLTAAPWGDSEQLEVGDEVLAVGNPFGLARTVTAGIISAKDRIVEATDRNSVATSGFQEFLQTDAAVNPGNSGGPLVNLRGEVVGINTAIVGEIYQGISFAIPSRLAREVYEKLVAGGRIARGWLGVAMDDLSEAETERLGLEKGKGVRVHRVVAPSPAEAAGIRAEDVIVRWNDHEIAGQFELSRAVARTSIGSSVTVELIREGRPMKLSVTVGERPAEP